ncbi:nitric oxide reductase transcriptional regulator NorR [Pseudomonas sp. HR96]|uniref:nitric oxide reductase transcriptional regulator NorR n=1 Tax=Pseudomonas sp. HR96 TaxID=1027966 RepID=UPI002A76623E|nr:nitric oxide reductase transcriptional regulator NorR [Pseudomonas sp. HR96]WPP00930.1 nitric oxide reductase transcriptional regulator NorR [Pseudomonas sp. HR96]
MKKQVNSTQQTETLRALLPLLSDLAEEIPAQIRYQRVLHALLNLLPSDAVALLRLDGAVLVPQAAHGLAIDAMARRYPVASHPRLQAIVDAPGAILFATDCGLPDPYDGLIGSSALPVHDCMGCALRINEQVWGVLTLDALQVGQFTDADLHTVETFARLAAATVVAAAHFDELRRSVEGERGRAEAWRLARQPAVQPMIGQSAAFKQLLSEIELVAPSDLTVLITGETGVGKELVARHLHEHSARAGKPMISVNCAALPEHLVESELFGHVKGAFSGAIDNRLGKFEMAHGGTLFLDEIGELPLAVQAKLLRVLQGGHLQRVGSDKSHTVDIRLLVATNRDLIAEVRAGRFRADLYHRLSVYPLPVPPLRERRDDILLLAGAFAEENRWRVGLPALRLSAAARNALTAYPWPGNIRELEYLLARAVLKLRKRAADSERNGVLSLDVQDLDLPVDTQTPAATAQAQALATPEGPVDFREAVDQFKKQLLQNTLQRHNGNLAAAARDLNLDRANLARLAHRLGIE